MALGQQLITSILSEEKKEIGAKHVKGVFTGDRNYAIMCRLYYYYKIKGFNYDKAVSLLNKEFFLSELRLQQIVIAGRGDLEKLKAMKADKRFLSNKLPHFNWN